MVTAKIRIDSSGLRRLIGRLRTVSDPLLVEMYKKWAVRYRRFSRARFDRYSKGGGNWPALSPETIKRRRHGGGVVRTGPGQFKRVAGGGKRGVAAYRKAIATGGGQVSILRDTGTLMDALEPIFRDRPGAWEKMIRKGIEVGFGGPGKHPKGNATIADIASFHQFGGRVPKREILVDPDQRTMNGFVRDAQTAILEMIRESDIGARRA